MTLDSPLLSLLVMAAQAAVLAGAAAAAPGPGQPAHIDMRGLPPRTALTPPPRPIPDWLRSHVRIAHLPPTTPTMAKQFVDAGYNVITANALRKWDIVGPSASLYMPEEVKAADEYQQLAYVTREYRADGVEVVVPTVDMHAMVVFETR